MLSVWNPILSQGRETRPLNCWMTSCLTLHQIHSLTWHMARTALKDKRNCISAFPPGVSWKRSQQGVWPFNGSRISAPWSVFFPWMSVPRVDFPWPWDVPGHRNGTFATRCLSPLCNRRFLFNFGMSCWERTPVIYFTSRTGLIKNGYCQHPVSLEAFSGRGRRRLNLPFVPCRHLFLRRFHLQGFWAEILMVKGQNSSYIKPQMPAIFI